MATAPDPDDEVVFLQLLHALTLDLCAELGVGPRSFSPETLTLMRALPWRDTPAELRRVLVGVLTAGRGDGVGVEEVLEHGEIQGTSVPPGARENLKEARLGFEREFIRAVLERHAWRMSEAARALGIQRPNLYRKARRLGLVRPVRSV